MRHYPHHISDFNNATRHLTRIERSLYRDLIDLYYETEQQLTLDLTALCRRILANECSTDVERVLNEFFIQTPKGWYHSRCEEEIEAYKSNSSQKALAGKASAEKKRLKKQQAINGDSTAVEQPLNFVETNCQQNSTNHQPSTINQSTNTLAKAKAASGDLSTKDEIWKAGKSLLSEQGMPEKQCGSFVGKLVKDYGADTVVDAVRVAVLERPADAASYLKAVCMRSKAPSKQQALEDHNDAVAAKFIEDMKNGKTASNY